MTVYNSRKKASPPDEPNTKGSLLLDVFKHNMKVANANGALKYTTPFDEILQDVLEYPVGVRVAMAHERIVSMVANAPAEKSESWKDIFRSFNCIFGFSEEPEKMSCIF